MRWLSSPAPALQMPMSYPVAGRRLMVLTPALVKAAHAKGKQVHIWTIDDSESMEKLIDLGVDGIFTDRVDTLKRVLVGRGLWA